MGTGDAALIDSIMEAKKEQGKPIPPHEDWIAEAAKHNQQSLIEHLRMKHSCRWNSRAVLLAMASGNDVPNGLDKRFVLLGGRN